MHDTVELEQRGVPTAVIITSAFVQEAEGQQAALGAPHLQPVVVPHPVSTLSDGEIKARAEGALPLILRTLTGS